MKCSYIFFWQLIILNYTHNDKLREIIPSADLLTIVKEKVKKNIFHLYYEANDSKKKIKIDEP